MRSYSGFILLQIPMPKHIIYLSAGSNIGDRKAHLVTAQHKLNNQIGKVIRQSNIYETEAWGNENQRGFFNQVLCLETDLAPQDVLSKINTIEQEMGRVREDKWAARTIDIDILFYDYLIYKGENLTIPHPHLQDRNFILVPFLEIAPEYLHPKLNQTIRELYFSCSDRLKVFLN